MAVKQHPGYCTVVELHRDKRANGVSKPFTAVGKTVGGLSPQRTQEPLKVEIFAKNPQMSTSDLYVMLQHYIDSLVDKLPEFAIFHGELQKQGDADRLKQAEGQKAFLRRLITI